MAKKRFAKGSIVEVNHSTTTQRWGDARYLGTAADRLGWHAVSILTEGGVEYREVVPSRRIRCKAV